ncbi:hypothetical protein ACLMAL_38745 [Nocardia sp. CWNU-33]|uniref:hypothetical protein n=1 Tax=Nocardia sp. CWNU-33 TaxID=3392117 RepID=UPI00398F08C8
MTHITPPRPVDLVAVFPELTRLARTATRLHPRPGTPSVHDSSIGGPLLWPASEPWPHCHAEDHDAERLPSISLADARLERRIRAARNSEGREYTTEEREILDRMEERPATDGPIAMLPVAQLYVRDVPGLHPPEGADLLQVLWCPYEHDDDGMPKTALFWRSAAAITDVLVDPPEPAEYEQDLVPEPCMIDPEQVIEYPKSGELEGELRQRVDQWTMAQIPGVEFDGLEDDDQPYDLLCIAPGWKIGGWISWNMQDPYPNPCPTCGTPTEPLLTIASREWEMNGRHWVPYEDQAADILWGAVQGGPSSPTQICVSDVNNQIIRICPTSHEHPHIQMMQ